MSEDRKLKHHSDGHLEAMIKYAANHDRWDQVRECNLELMTRRKERLAKSAS